MDFAGRTQTNQREVPVELLESSAEEDMSEPESVEELDKAHSDVENALLMGATENDNAQPTQSKTAKDGGQITSDATADEEERVQVVEKADTEVAAVGGEFGDTTEEEEDVYNFLESFVKWCLPGCLLSTP